MDKLNNTRIRNLKIARAATTLVAGIGVGGIGYTLTSLGDKPFEFLTIGIASIATVGYNSYLTYKNNIELKNEKNKTMCKK